MSAGSDKDKAGFIGRWSRLKRQGDAPEDPAKAAPADGSRAAPEPADGPIDVGMPVPEAISAEDLARLPRVDQILADTDLMQFLRPGVPEALKNAALRKMWSADPAIRDYVDSALDYAWDWNSPGGVPGGGGLLDLERVGQMVRDLIGGAAEPLGGADRTTEVAGGAGADLPDPTLADPTLAVPLPDEIPPTLAARPTQVVVKPSVAKPADPPPGSAIHAARRHGGARPG